MLIAIDYDLTYSADPILFGRFASMAKHFGHEVVICTVRNAELDTIDVPSMVIYYTDGLPKRETMEAFGKKVDIWIDDKPESIIRGSETNAIDLAAWRVQQHGILKPVRIEA